MACITNVPRSHKFGVTAFGDFNATNGTAVSSVFRQISNGLSTTPVFEQDEGHNGTPFYASEGVVKTSEAGSGSVVLQPRADELRVILPLLLGGTFAGNIIEPDINGYCQYFKASRDVKVAVFEFLNCKTSQWTLSSSRSQSKLQLDWGIEACGSARQAAGTFPVLNFSTQPPFVHTSSTFTIDGRVVPVDDVQLSGNNNLTTDLFYNSVTRTALPAGRQMFTLTATSPFDTSLDLAWMDIASASVAASIVYTTASGTLSLTINIPAMHPVIPTPQTPAGEQPVRFEQIVWTARSKGTGGSYQAPIRFTIDDIV
jgi:hypothetical protein